MTDNPNKKHTEKSKAASKPRRNGENKAFVKTNATPEVSPARLLAFRSLGKMKYGKYTNIEISTTLSRETLSEADRNLYTALVYGVTERLITLDYAIGIYSSRPVEKIDNGALCALRMGIYQLYYMDRIPDHAAVSESVELAGAAGGFVNAVLRSFIRNNKQITFPSNGSATYRFSVIYSVPEELCRRFICWYGEETAEKIFAAFYSNRKISLRINTMKISAKEAAQMISGAVSTIASDVVTADSFDGISSGINRGLWFVQDEASAYCAEILGAIPGETVVDCCAAPGGKSFASAVRMNNEGSLYAFDLHENKLSLIKSGAMKLGISIISTMKCDARSPVQSLLGKADRVLCDAPCSGLGVIGKKPDIKYKSPEAIDNLPSVQSEVLRGAAEYVRPGGTLVYSTCTLNPAENGEVVKGFLMENCDFEPFPFDFQNKSNCEMTFLPFTNGTDGFYICRMRRKETVK